MWSSLFFDGKNEETKSCQLILIRHVYDCEEKQDLNETKNTVHSIYFWIYD